MRPASMLTRFNQRDCMTSPTFTTSSPVRAAVLAITRACTWAVGLRRPVKVHHLSDSECDSEGVPYGTTELAAYAFPLTGALWWRVDAWNDGDCFQLRALGWSIQVFYEPQQVTPAVA